jgi:hypothetical protein
VALAAGKLKLNQASLPVVGLLIGMYEIIGTSKSPETGATPLTWRVIHYQK